MGIKNLLIKAANLLAALLFIGVPLSMKAYDFTVDGIQYNFLPGDSVQCEVVGYDYEYWKDKKSIVIPGRIEALGTQIPVLRIAPKAFENCTYSSVTLGEGIKTIGDWAFNCAYLQKINFPESVDSIGRTAFYHTQIDSLILPRQLRRINPFCFASIISLKYVSLPDSLKEIGNNAFAKISLSDTLRFPAGLKLIDEFAFGYANLKHIVFPDGTPCTEIKRYAFLFDGGERNLTIGTCVKSMEGFAFRGEKGYYYHPRYSKLKFSNGIKSIGSSVFAFAQIDDLYLPESLEEIGDSAFYYGDKQFTNIYNFPRNIKKIGKYNFGSGGIISADTISLLSVSSIPEGLFKHTLIPGMVLINDTISTIGAYAFYDSEVNKIKLPSKLKEIGAYAFAHNAFKKILPSDSVYEDSVLILPKSVKHIGEGAFYRSFRLKKADINSEIDNLSPDMFWGSVRLETISLPSSIKSIGSNAFEECRSLQSPILPNGITTIGENAFKGCKTITTIKLPENLTSLENNAFDGCDSLSEITFNECLKTIGNESFKDCPNISSVILPSSVESIGNGAFTRCQSLATIHSLNSTPPACFDDSFPGLTYRLGKLYVPENSVAAYSSAEGWKNFYSILVTDMGAVDTVITDSDLTKPVRIYTLSGHLIYSGLYNDNNISVPGIYVIVYYNGKSEKRWID